MHLQPKVERRVVVGLLVAGLAARLVFGALYPAPLVADAVTYRDLGVALAQGQGYALHGVPETIIAPAYPCFLACVFRLFGPNLYAVSALQATLDVAGCALFWAWLRRRISPEAAAISLALQLAAMSAIAASRVIRAESLSATLLCVCLVLVDLARAKSRGWPWAALAGLMLGVLTLTRWNFSLFPLVAVLWLWLTRTSAATFARNATALGIAFFVTLAPWMLRNQRLLGAPVLSTQTGLTFYMSHFRNPDQPYGNNTHDATTALADKLPPLESSRFLVEKTIERLRAHPAKPFVDYPEKLLYLFVPIDWETLGYRKINFTYALIAILALFGIVPLWRQDRGLVLLLCAPLAFLVALSFPFYGSPRFRLPAEPPLTAIAAIGLIRLRRPRDKSEPSIARF